MNTLPFITQNIQLDTTDSTNRYAQRRISHYASDTGNVIFIQAQRQWAGRGRDSRSWYSPAGCLMFTLVFSGSSWRLSSEHIPLIGITAALAIREAVGHFLIPSHSLGLHWPNDLYARKEAHAKWKKIAGILTETSYQKNGCWIFLGVGVNIQNTSLEAPDDLREKIISLSELPLKEDAFKREDASIKNTDSLMDEVKERFLAGFFSSFIPRLRENPAEISMLAQSCCVQLGQMVQVSRSSGMMRGLCTGLGENGAMIISFHGHAEEIHSASDIRVISDDK